MRTLTIPSHLPLIETIGLALTVAAFMAPSVRTTWLLWIVCALYVYCSFWDMVDLYQRGLLTKSVRQICQQARQGAVRTRFQGAAFSLLGCILLLKYLL